MYFSDEETGNVVVGEAAIHLIFNSEEVTLRSLIDTLREMAESEADDLRVMQIYKARKWLMGLREPATSLSLPHGMKTPRSALPAEPPLPASATMLSFAGATRR
ncbi:hypothetical protein GKQ23_12120 [Erwinia sp. E602]|uniref:hypothetical protein n=1 Tax=unclassified Erwinia TaxID=2622719 RepID=UPI0006F3C8F9|nr:MULTISPECIES: hypothetical protein [unclassified Erwinia]KQN55665.1 hypothetical protein ASF13_09230 [Erwinia sp. Leaf53]PLV61967.1 hypothetical protein NV64_07755 [Erwinia sp. B116]QUG75693.1 hypothetical protein GKQ23_12120 [Erwinia sp. E602]